MDGGLTVFLRTHATMKRIKNILLNEDKFSRHYRLHQHDVTDREKQHYKHVPIEKTWTGRNVDYLLQVLVGEKTVSPSGVVAPRILRRIANVLMGIEWVFLRQCIVLSCFFSVLSSKHLSPSPPLSLSQFRCLLPEIFFSSSLYRDPEINTLNIASKWNPKDSEEAGENNTKEHLDQETLEIHEKEDHVLWRLYKTMVCKMNAATILPKGCGQISTQQAERCEVELERDIWQWMVFESVTEDEDFPVPGTKRTAPSAFKTFSQDALTELLKQFNVFTHYGGIDRLLYFMQNDPDKGSDSQGLEEAGFDVKDGASVTIPASEILIKLRDFLLVIGDRDREEERKKAERARLGVLDVAESFAKLAKPGAEDGALSSSSSRVLNRRNGRDQLLFEYMMNGDDDIREGDAGQMSIADQEAQHAFFLGLPEKSSRGHRAGEYGANSGSEQGSALASSKNRPTAGGYESEKALMVATALRIFLALLRAPDLETRVSQRRRHCECPKVCLHAGFVDLKTYHECTPNRSMPAKLSVMLKSSVS